jgi:PUA-domain protein
MNQKQIRKSEIKKINSQIKELYGLDDFISKTSKAEIIEDKSIKLLAIDNVIQFFFKDDLLIPTLKNLKDFTLPSVIVDMGAIKFVSNGADIMRPGITHIDNDIKKGDILQVIDENNKVPISICQALFDAQDMKQKDTGKVLKNLHYVGDEVWNYK